MCDSAEQIPFEDPTDVFYTNVDYETIRNKATEKPKATENVKNRSKIPSKIQDNSQQRKKRKQTEEFQSLNKKSKKICNEEKNEQDIPNSEQYLRSLGLTKLACIGDGNCFFRAVAILTRGRYAFLRRAVVSIMSGNANLFECFFTYPLKDNYFIEESSVHERCLNMEKDKTWAGFLERFAAGLHIKKNIYELYETPTGKHWNVFVGESGIASLDQTRNDDIFISYSPETMHFNPLRPNQDFTGNIKVTNIYFLVKHSLPNAEGVFLKMHPSELIPTHRLYQEESDQTFYSKPVGLVNIGNTCYFNSIMQCIKVFPELYTAFQSDLQQISNQDGVTKKVTMLLKLMMEKERSDLLENGCRTVISKLQERFPDKYEFGKQHDPQEVFTDILMMINQEFEWSQDMGYQSFKTLAETVNFQENFFKSQSTKLITSYLKIDRQMHSKCLNTSFQAMSFLLIPFPVNQKHAISIEKLMENYLQEEKRQILSCSECGFPNPQTIEHSQISKYPSILIIKLLR